jgi:hypothetical protein
MEQAARSRKRQPNPNLAQRLPDRQLHREGTFQKDSKRWTLRPSDSQRPASRVLVPKPLAKGGLIKAYYLLGKNSLGELFDGLRLRNAGAYWELGFTLEFPVTVIVDFLKNGKN